MGQRIQKALQKVEEKKKKRAARKAQWDALFANKPGEGGLSNAPTQLMLESRAIIVSLQIARHSNTTGRTRWAV